MSEIGFVDVVLVNLVGLWILRVFLCGEELLLSKFVFGVGVFMFECVR